MDQTAGVTSGRLTRRAAIAGGVCLAGAGGIARIGAQTPAASPQATPAGSPAASPIASPVASPVASPAATPIATPVPDYPLDIFPADDLPDDGRPRRGGTLRLPVSTVSLLDFVLTTQRQDPQVAWSYLDALVRIDPETGIPAPALARSWAWADDGRSLTFTLRDDVTWHDGSAFTAEDARFSHIAYRDDYESVIAAQSGLVADVVAVDEKTLQVTFEEPDGAWLFNVASLPVFQAAQYRPMWEANPEGERTLEGIRFDGSIPVGTGPWKIESATADRVSLVRNEEYFETPPHADRLELIGVNNGTDPVSLWQDGELDIVGEVDPQRVERLLQTTGRLIVTHTPRAFFAAYNFDNPNRFDPGMLGQLEVRRALSLALDRARYAKDIWGGFLQSGLAGIVPQQWVGGEPERTPKQDRREARRLLEEAGWTDLDGDGIRDSQLGDSLSLTAVVLDSVQPAVIETLAAMQEDLAEIGAALDVQVVPRDRFVTIWTVERTWDLLVYDLRLYPAFNEFDLIGSAWDIRSNADGWNPGGYANPEADAAIAAYFASVDEDGMADALRELQRAIVEDPFALWLGFPRDLVLLAPEVRGFVPSPLWPTLETRTAWFATDD